MKTMFSITTKIIIQVAQAQRNFVFPESEQSLCAFVLCACFRNFTSIALVEELFVSFISK